MKQFRNTQYFVYEDGRIFNSTTKRWVKPFEVKLSRNSTKRLVVGLYINGIQKTIFYHRILAECWIPNPNNYPQINHKDGNPLNNNLSNLEWCTAKENNIHAINKGLRPTKLNKQIADQIREKHKNGISQKELAKEYSVGKTIINKIVNNISWIW